MTAKAKPETEPAIAQHLSEKETRLRNEIRSARAAIIAYSGGVDSTYLAHIANQELGSKAVCMMGLSPSVSSYQRTKAAEQAGQLGFNFQTIETKEIENAHYSANPANRCYFCKSELYDEIREAGVRLNIESIFDGTNADDLSDIRPGRQAASERGVRSPLAEAGLSKSDIRELSRYHGLETWNEPASPCLSSRIEHGVPVTIQRLSKVERGEEILRGLGFREFRVRLHDDLARIEIAPAELVKALDTEMFSQISRLFRELGFRYSTIDLEGFRSGSMNKVD